MDAARQQQSDKNKTKSETATDGRAKKSFSEFQIPSSQKKYSSDALCTPTAPLAYMTEKVIGQISRGRSHILKMRSSREDMLAVGAFSFFVGGIICSLLTLFSHSRLRVQLGGRGEMEGWGRGGDVALVGKGTVSLLLLTCCCVM